MSMVGFPLLLIPLAIYNIVIFLMPGVSFADSLFKLPLMSGAEWPVNLSDLLLAIGVFLLLLEIIKGARPGAKFLTDHLLSPPRPPSFCFGRGSAPRPIFCSPCWRWWISCRELHCAPGVGCRSSPPRLSDRQRETPWPGPLLRYRRLRLQPSKTRRPITLSRKSRTIMRCRAHRPMSALPCRRRTTA
jgi:hypothetical protein